VRGSVTAEPGRLGTPALFAIADDTAGILVRLPDGVRGPERGTYVEVTGPLAAPYGQLEVRPAAAGLGALGVGTTQTAVSIGVRDAGESTEGHLVSLAGMVTVAPRRATSGDIAFTIRDDAGGELRVLADASAQVPTTAVRIGDRAVLTGIVGQRASRKGALDGYRLWLRDVRDVVRIASPAPTGSALPGPASGTSPDVPVTISIADARLLDDAAATVEGIVTAGPALLDASGRRIVLEDRTGAIEVLLPQGAAAPRIGDGLRVSGTVGRAYGAVRIRASALAGAQGGSPVPLVLRVAPGPAHEWRLVRVSGTLVDVRRLGERWVAELQVGSARVPVAGLPGAGIPSTAAVEGRAATVTGIVRRPYPTATDRRSAVVPRAPGDLVVGPAEPSRVPVPAGRTAAGPGGPGAPGGSPAGRPDESPRDVDLGEIGEHLGTLVRVGGIVIEVAGDGVVIDDGTATGRVVLRGEAAELLPMLQVGDALNAIGRPERMGDLVVVVDDPAGLHLVGALGEPVAISTVAPSAGAGDPAPDAVRASVRRGFGLDPETAGLGTLAVVAALSVLATLVRRHRARRLLQARIVARLEALAPSRAPGEERPR